MTRQEDFDAALKDWADQWNKAEKAIKQAEQVNDEIVNPAIYELRYSGRRVVEAVGLFSENPDDAKKKLDDAIFDCCRAQHDAIDAVTAKILADIRIALDKLGVKPVLQFFPDVLEVKEDLAEVRQKIARSRENRESRDDVYDVIASVDLPNLLSKFSRFQNNEGLLKAEVKKERIAKVINYAIGVGGLILSAVGLYLSFSS